MATNVKHAKVSAKSDGSDSGLVQPSDWNNPHEGALEILGRDLVTDEVVSSITEESIYSASIGANVLGATGGVRLTLGGDLLCADAGNDTLTFRIKFGATTVITANSITLPAAAARYKWSLEVLLMNSAAGAQRMLARIRAVTESNDQDMCILLGDASQGFVGEGYGTASEDTTGALTLDVTAQWGTNSASLSVKCHVALLELIPPA